MADIPEIRFYRSNEKHGFLSSLFKCNVEFEGRTFPSSEHAYQFGKFRDPKAREWAMQAPSPHLLAILAHSLFIYDIVENWSEIKEARMHAVLLAKFRQNPEIGNKLQETGEAILIENSKTDTFWGIGKRGNGKNVLGNLLMQVRSELKKDSFLLNK